MNVHDDIIEQQQESVYSASRAGWAFWRKNPRSSNGEGERECGICKAKTNECSNDKTSMGEG